MRLELRISAIDIDERTVPWPPGVRTVAFGRTIDGRTDSTYGIGRSMSISRNAVRLHVDPTGEVTVTIEQPGANCRVYRNTGLLAASIERRESVTLWPPFDVVLYTSKGASSTIGVLSSQYQPEHLPSRLPFAPDSTMRDVWEAERIMASPDPSSDWIVAAALCALIVLNVRGKDRDGRAERKDLMGAATAWLGREPSNGWYYSKLDQAVRVLGGAKDPHEVGERVIALRLMPPHVVTTMAAELKRRRGQGA